MISRRTFTRGLVAFLLCGLILLNCAFNGSCGKAPVTCADPPCAQPTPDPGAEKAKAIAYAREFARQFQIITPLITRNHPEAATQLGKITADANKLIDAVEQDDSIKIVAMLANLAPAFTAVVDEYTDDISVQIGLAIADEALNFFAGKFGEMAGQVAISKTAVVRAKGEAILRFRDGSHLRARNKADGRFVSLGYALTHKDEVLIEKSKPLN